MSLGMGLSRGPEAPHVTCTGRSDLSSEQLQSKLRNGKIRSRFVVIFLINSKD